MKYGRVQRRESARLVAVAEDESYDLTSASDGDVGTILDLGRMAVEADRTLDEVAGELLQTATESEFDPEHDLTVPIADGEIWTAGGTYERADAARGSKSIAPAVYERLSTGDLPELDFKATPTRAVGHDDAIGIRTDSDRNVAAPSLALVLYDGDIIGYTIALTARSRAIEAANPLYTQQARTYDRCCALGPWVVAAEAVDDPHGLDVSMTVHSAGARVFEDSGSTAELTRPCSDLIDALTSHQTLPDPTVLLTGEAVVPPTEFTLADGDEIIAEIEALGSLRVSVTAVS